MLTIKCPHCSTALKLAQAPPSGKVKCPKCSNVVPVQSAGPVTPAAQPQRAPVAQPQRTPVASGGPIDPDDDAFDFGRINFPSATGANAVNTFPMPVSTQAYTGPIPGDPLNFVVDTPEEQSTISPYAAGQAAAAVQSKQRNPKVLIGILAGVGALLLVVIGVVAITMMSGGDGGGGSEDMLAAAKLSAPQGYDAHGIEGVVVLIPKGEMRDGKSLPSIIECVGVESDKTGSFFFMGAMDGGKLPLDKKQMIKKASRQLGGEILGGTDTTRNGHKGYKGMLDGSLFLPRMQVEVYHIDERFCILGCAPFSMGADPSVQMSVDRKLEEAEQDLFYGSFKVGPKPSGFFGN